MNVKNYDDILNKLASVLQEQDKAKTQKDREELIKESEKIKKDVEMAKFCRDLMIKLLAILFPAMIAVFIHVNNKIDRVDDYIKSHISASAVNLKGLNNDKK